VDKKERDQKQNGGKEETEVSH